VFRKCPCLLCNDGGRPLSEGRLKSRTLIGTDRKTCRKMVAKIISGKYIKGMLNYNEKKVLDGSARLILANGFAMDIGRLDLKGKLKRFEYRTMLNTRAKTN